MTAAGADCADGALVHVHTDQLESADRPRIEFDGVQSDHLPADGAQRLLEVRGAAIERWAEER
ncbi:hypothetical protein RSW84_26860, partial [Escherichia coli]|uniref:hypothetical protein n=1 Tax=Escherichia coli TaxID=562 RepID=UPI0028DF2704